MKHLRKQVFLFIFHIRCFTLLYTLYSECVWGILYLFVQYINLTYDLLCTYPIMVEQHKISIQRERFRVVYNKLSVTFRKEEMFFIFFIHMKLHIGVLGLGRLSGYVIKCYFMNSILHN